MSLVAVPIDLAEAHAFVDRIHRHHSRSIGGKFAIGAALRDAIVGVAVVGRPVARLNQDGFSAEVTRLATDGTPNACSFLYAACWRACRAMGYRRLGTYTLTSEPGTSLVAAGWKLVGTVKGRSWDSPSRPRVDKHPTQDKFRWERSA